MTRKHVIAFAAIGALVGAAIGLDATRRHGYVVPYISVAVLLGADATPEQIAAIDRLVSGSPLVWRVYRDVAPDAIRLDAPTAGTRTPPS